MAPHRQRGAALHVERNPDEITQGVHKILNVTFGLREDFSGITCFNVSQYGFIFFHLIGETMKQHTALIGWHFGPTGAAKGLCGGLHGPIYISETHGSYFSERSASAGILGRKSSAIRSGDPFPADEGLVR